MISTVPQGHCRIVERFGRPAKVQRAGINFNIPFIDTFKDVSQIWRQESNGTGDASIVAKYGDGAGQFIELTEQIHDTEERDCITKDNAKVKTDAVISWRIIDPLKAVYEVDRLHESLEQACLNILRSEIGSHDLDDVLENRKRLNDVAVTKLSATVGKWGVQLLRVEIQELKVDGKTSEAMLQQLEAERKSRALALEAEGEAKAKLSIAKADRDAQILIAEGQAQALKIIAESEKVYLETLTESIGAEKANGVLLAQKAIEGYNVISKNPADKVFVPNNATALIGDQG